MIAVLAAAVRHEARMSAPVKTGGVTRDHVEAAVRRGMVPESELYGPEVPDVCAHLWDWHRELARVRQYDGASGHAQALTYGEIDAWARLTGRAPGPQEVDALIYLDMVSRAPDAKTTEPEEEDDD